MLRADQTSAVALQAQPSPRIDTAEMRTASTNEDPHHLRAATPLIVTSARRGSAGRGFALAALRRRRDRVAVTSDHPVDRRWASEAIVRFDYGELGKGGLSRWTSSCCWMTPLAVTGPRRPKRLARDRAAAGGVQRAAMSDQPVTSIETGAIARRAAVSLGLAATQGAGRCESWPPSSRRCPC